MRKPQEKSTVTKSTRKSSEVVKERKMTVPKCLIVSNVPKPWTPSLCRVQNELTAYGKAIQQGRSNTTGRSVQLRSPRDRPRGTFRRIHHSYFWRCSWPRFGGTGPFCYQKGTRHQRSVFGHGRDLHRRTCVNFRFVFQNV